LEYIIPQAVVAYYVINAAEAEERVQGKVCSLWHWQ